MECLRLGAHRRAEGGGPMFLTLPDIVDPEYPHWVSLGVIAPGIGGGLRIRLRRRSWERSPTLIASPDSV